MKPSPSAQPEPRVNLHYLELHPLISSTFAKMVFPHQVLFLPSSNILPCSLIVNPVS